MPEMTPISAAEMRKIEQDAIASGRVTGRTLMERAGQGVVEAICETWPELEVSQRGANPSRSQEFGGPSETKRAVVLCGPGNNGGDGFVVARLLARRGWDVDVFLYGDADTLPPDARVNHARWCEIGSVTALTDESFDDFARAQSGVTVYVDALFGIGLSRPFATLGRVRDALSHVHSEDCVSAAPFVVCVDIPSGLSSETGRYLGHETESPADNCVRGSLTVTFHRPKVGHLIADGPRCCGKLVVKDIGL